MSNLLHTTNLEVDRNAAAYFKVETVQVHFAVSAGTLTSRVGPNHYLAGDAIVSATDGEKWVVSRQRFEEKYLPLISTHIGQAGKYEAKKIFVLAKQMPIAFSVARETNGDILTGSAGDWLVQYAPGDFGVVLKARFERIYKRVSISDC